jgi:hypothetical protein
MYAFEPATLLCILTKDLLGSPECYVLAAGMLSFGQGLPAYRQCWCQ